MSRRSINLGSKIERVWEWIFPSVIIALVPVLAQYFVNLLNGEFISYRTLSFIETISPKGELMIVAVALVAESVGEIWRRQIPRRQKSLFGSLCISFVMFSTFIYSNVIESIADPYEVSYLSFHLFVFGFIGCVICKIAGRS